MSCKVVVAGGRDFVDRRRMQDVLCLICLPGDTIITGGASGADALGKAWAITQQKSVSHLEMPADWDTHGKAAGAIRNQQMAQAGDVLVAFWDGRSKGTKHMIEAATRCGLEVHIYRYGDLAK